MCKQIPGYVGGGTFYYKYPQMYSIARNTIYIINTYVGLHIDIYKTYRP